ncbi:Transposase family Tnp2 protein [Ceratobasidium sp. AG-Ba]|nr:Transposase family Tnp2 protein [Ceratobasidium sp. AG-Ba]
MLDDLEDRQRPQGPTQTDEIPGTPPDMVENESDGENEPRQIEEWEIEVDEDLHEYPFHHLLGDDEDNVYYHNVDDYGVNVIGDEQEEDIEDQRMFDENLGIPRGEENDNDHQPFQFDEDEALDQEQPDYNPDDPAEDGDNGDSPAFSEHPLIRNAYIDVFIQKVLYGVTHRALRHQLRAARRTIAANAEVPLESIAKMAQTIKTVESRLGVNMDSFITTFTLCPSCGRRYSPEYLATTDEATCLNPGCEGVLFTIRRQASGGQRRVSNLTYPFASPIAWLKHMLGIPGMCDLMQTWRKDRLDGDDDWNITAPIPSNVWMNNLDINRPIGDISDGWGWRSTSAGLERRQDPQTRNLVDVNVLNPPVRFTGIRFTALHRIPGWDTASLSPPDAMHLLYLGGMNWIVKQVLVAPGIFNKRHQNNHEPQDLFNDCLDAMWVPKNFQRLPPKIGQTQASTKADQWKLTSRILYIPLYLALRDGDGIGADNAPIGPRSSPAAKYCAYRAKLLHKQRQKHYNAIGRPDLCPGLAECASSRNLQFHYRQVLRFCLAVNTIDKRSITPAEIGFAQQLLETLCKSYVSNNIPLPPNFHYMMHLEEFMLKTASVYNTHVWGMERANRIVSQINNNGKSKGVLEGTYMRGWWSHTTIQTLINIMRSLPDRTEADDSIIQDLLETLDSPVEKAQQNGALAQFIAQCQTAYTKLYGIQESTTLSPQSRLVDLEKLGLYELVTGFCINLWPDAGIFGPGMVRDRYFAPVGMVRGYSYVELNGIRYGSYHHSSGNGYCYGYIDDQRTPVRIKRVLSIQVPGDPELSCICALVRRFQAPRIEPQFPWDTWAGNLGAASWEYNELGNIEAISHTRFSGAFALFKIPMSYGDYWVTVALDSVSLEQRPDNEGEGHL